MEHEIELLKQEQEHIQRITRIGQGVDAILAEYDRLRNTIQIVLQLINKDKRYDHEPSVKALRDEFGYNQISIK